MKSDRCLRELLSIAHIQGLTWEQGTEAREKALKSWINQWIMEYEHEQSYIKTNFSEEEKEFIDDYAKRTIIDKLMEECVDKEDSTKKLRMKVRALKV